MTAKPEDLLRDLRDETDRDTYAIMEDAVDLIEDLLAQNRWLQDELEKAKAELGARNRILTEEP